MVTRAHLTLRYHLIYFILNSIEYANQCAFNTVNNMVSIYIPGFLWYSRFGTVKARVFPSESEYS